MSKKNKTQLIATGAVAVVTAIGLLTYHDAQRRKRQFEINKPDADEEKHSTVMQQTIPGVDEFNCKFNAPYGEPIAAGTENTIYSSQCQVTMNTRRTGVNNNSIIIGAAGLGKSYNVALPNLLQQYGSYVVMDPYGAYLATTGTFFEENDYDIRVFNLNDVTNSYCYNPFEYLRGEEDVTTLVECLIRNMKIPTQGSDDLFHEKAEKMLLEAIVFYLIHHQDKDKQNLATVYKLLSQMPSQLDAIFDGVRQYDEKDICVKKYDIFKRGSDKTTQSILITAAVRLAPFNIEAVENLTSSDDMDLKTIGDKPTITYVIASVMNNNYTFLLSVLYSQMFDTLHYHASMNCEGQQLKYDVRFILDEFYNIGIIPDFHIKLPAMRKYGLSCIIFGQTVDEIKDLYRRDWEVLLNGCDTMVYLGGNKPSSMEELLKRAGGQLTIDEVQRLRDNHCIVIIKGREPFFDKKYETQSHPKACKLGDIRTDFRLYNFDYHNTKP